MSFGDNSVVTTTPVFFRRLATATSLISLLVYAALLCITPASINEIGRSYSINSAQQGHLFLGMMIGFLSSVFIAGRFSDKHGKLPAMLIGCTVMTIGLLIFANAPGYFMLIIASIIMGYGGGFAEPTSMAMIADLYSGQTKTAWMNASQAIFGVGAVASPIAISLLLNAGLDWRLGYYATAILCALAALLALRSVLTRQETPVGTHTENGDWRKLLSDRTLLWLCLGILLYVGAELGNASWLAKYFKEGLSAERAFAAATPAFFWLGIGLGRVAGIWGSRLLSDLAMVELSLLGAAASQCILLSFIVPVGAAISTVSLGFFLGPIFPTIVSRAGKAYPNQSGTVSGIVLACGSLGGAIFPPLIGQMAEATTISTALWMAFVIILVNIIIFARLTHIERKNQPA